MMYPGTDQLGKGCCAFHEHSSSSGYQVHQIGKNVDSAGADH